ncbi:hypothetical protein FIU87_01520 [Bacillus sp. THAF10]|nr:hypothetical protein FIU87_01520 [Bacillus sp. THAF10]
MIASLLEVIASLFTVIASLLLLAPNRAAQATHSPKFRGGPAFKTESQQFSAAQKNRSRYNPLDRYTSNEY